MSGPEAGVQLCGSGLLESAWKRYIGQECTFVPEGADEEKTGRIDKAYPVEGAGIEIQVVVGRKRFYVPLKGVTLSQEVYS